MDTNIYYIPKHQGILITSDFTEIQRRMDIGMDPRIEYKQISASDIGQFIVKYVSFYNLHDNYLHGIKEVFAKYKFEAIAFHHSIADLSGIVFNVRHLIVGESSKIDIASENFKHLNEVTFLSVKTFKGKILNKIDSVEKLILWYENKKSNVFLSMFPNLTNIQINNGTISELDLMANPLLKVLQLHRCTKLERVNLIDNHNLREVIVENCNKLDVYNLGNNVRRI